MKRDFISLLILFTFGLSLAASITLSSSAFAMPMKPELEAKLKAENRFESVVRILKQAREKGVEAPNPKPFRAEKDKKAIVNTIAILVDFSDNQADTTNYPKSHFDSLLSFQGTYPTGSLRDYYLENSYNNVDIITTVTGWYRMPQTYTYYVDGNYGWGDYPNNCQKLTEDAVYAANPYVDFSQFDNDGDGYIDALFIIHSGPGAESTGDSNDIWSHAWVTYDVPYVDGVYANSYSTEPEDGEIGVFCHELGHALFGLPDLYDYDYDSEGVGNWTLMAGGSWGNGGRRPSHLDAWCKIECNFLTPEVPTLNQTDVIIPYVEFNPTVYKLWTSGTPANEYFLVENRQKAGFDNYLPGGGLLVYHVDDNQSGNNNQWYPGYTNYGHYLVAVEQADGNWDLEQNNNRGDAGDPYPGTTNNRFFNDTSTPDSKDYGFNITNVRVENISNSGDTMTADIGVSPVPDILVLPDTLQFTHGGTKSNIQVLETSSSHRVEISEPIKLKSGVPSNTFARVPIIDPVLESSRHMFSFAKPGKEAITKRTLLGFESWITYYNGSPAYLTWSTPERTTYFDMADFPNVQYPFYIKKLKNIFYEDSDYLWDSDQFTFKIYADDGFTLLYESPQFTAQRYPQVTECELGADSVEITSSGFWVSVKPVSSSGYPSCLADSVYQGHSFYGSPGSWAAWTSGEFAKYACLSWGGGDSDTVKTMIVRNIGGANLDVTNITGSQSWITSINPTSFIVIPDGSQNVTVTVTRDGLTNGTYYDSLLMYSNDTDENPYIEPVKFVVGSGPTDPDISVTPDTLDFSYGEGKVAGLSGLEPAFDSPVFSSHDPDCDNDLYVPPEGKKIGSTGPKSQIQKPTTLSFAEVKGTVDTLIYDDGDPEGGYYWAAGTRMAMRMSPSDSCRVLTVQYYCWSGTGTQTIDATLFEWTGSAPGSQLGSPVNVSMDESGEWRTADFSSQNIEVGGDFIAAFCMNNDQTILGYDKIDCGRAWDYDGSSWSLWNETYFIRAIVDDGEGPVSDTVKQMIIYNTGNADLNVTGIAWTPDWIISTVPDLFTVPLGDSQNVTVTVTRDGLTNGTYYDSLLMYSNDPDENPYIEPVKFVVSGVVTPPSLIAPDSGLHISDNTPLFDWNDVVGATKYWLQIDNDDGFSSPVIDDSILTTSLYTPTAPLAETLYYWRVCAGNILGWSDWSEIWSFVVDTTSPVIDSTTQLQDSVDFWGPFTVDAKILDNFNIKEAVLFFRINSSEWISDTMASTVDYWYMGEIPEQIPADTLTIDYYITATDYADNLSRDPEEGNYSFKIFLTGIQETVDIPDRFVLFSPTPNPSIGMIKIQYGLPKKANVSLQVYDIQGRLVKSIYSGYKDAGYYKLHINSKDLSSGIYFLRFETEGYNATRKLLVIR